MMKGYRTIALGILQAAIGIADLIASKADVIQTGGIEGWALLVSGALMIVMRVVTNTPLGRSQPTRDV